MEIINMKFAEYGFDVNYDRGKTEAVVSFRGSRTVEMRKKFVLCDKPGISIQVAPDRQKSACYKHLGTTYSTTHNLEQELRHRIGSAKGAFRQLSRAVVCIRNYSRSGRLRLFHSLAGPWLFFGLGAWETPSPRLMQRLRIVYPDMLKKVLNLASTSPTNRFWCRQALEIFVPA